MSTTHHTKLGAFVVLGLGTAFAALIWLGAGSLQAETRDFVTFLDEAVTGLEVGSPVRFRGVTLGAVSKITVAPNQRLIEVHAEVPLTNLERLFTKEKLEATRQGFVPDDIRVQLVSSALTGVKFLQIDVFPDPETYPKLKLGFPPPENYIPSVPSTLKDLSDSLSETFHRLPKLADRLSSLSLKIEAVLVDLDAPGLSNRVRGLLETAETKLEAVDTGSLATKIEDVLAEAHETLASTRTLINDVQDEDGQVMQLVSRLTKLTNSIDDALAKLQPEATGRELRATAQAFSGVAAETTGVGTELQASLRALREASESVTALADSLKRDPGSLLHGRQPSDVPPGD